MPEFQSARTMMMAKTTTRTPADQRTPAQKPSGTIDLRKWGPKQPKFEYGLSNQAHIDKVQAEFRRITDIVEAARRALDQLAERYEFDMPYRVALLRHLLREYENPEKSAESLQPLPTAPPEAWSDRLGRKENPVAFIRRVYEPWLGSGLTRADLRNLDLPLYRALSVWVHRHPEDELPELPSLSQVIDEKIARLADEFSPDELRRLGLALQNRLRRK